jgi:4-hydroxybenzoate polyprenyltransferase
MESAFINSCSVLFSVNFVHTTSRCTNMALSPPSKLTFPVSLIPSSTSLGKVSIDTVVYHTHTLYLFTASDFLTFAVPTTLFGLCAALSGPVLTSNASPSLFQTFIRIPPALAVIWLNLLVFNIANQRSPSAVQEDRINKPHRPIPSGRISSEQAGQLLFVLFPMTLVLGYGVGVWKETVLLSVFQHLYNDLHGCDGHFLVRNALIASGYALYSAISFKMLVLAPGFELKTEGWRWIAVVAAVMFTTQHICDIKDAEGDRSRDRRSAPIVLGDGVCRWSVAVPVMLWSVSCPAFFDLGMLSYVLTMGLGGLVAGRTVVLRDLKSDRLTWKVWALWTCSLFVLPVIRNPEVLRVSLEGMVGLGFPGEEYVGAVNVAAFFWGWWRLLRDAGYGLWVVERETELCRYLLSTG